MRTTHPNYTREDLIWGFRYWWPHRHGVNSGEIREIIKTYIKHLHEKETTRYSKG